MNVQSPIVPLSSLPFGVTFVAIDQLPPNVVFQKIDPTSAAITIDQRGADKSCVNLAAGAIVVSLVEVQCIAVPYKAVPE